MNRQDLQELYTLKPNANTIFIHAKLLNPDLIARVTEKCKDSEYWHKFVIRNVGNLSKQLTLKTIIDFVHPSDLFPAFCTRKKNVFFLARNCLDAILKFISNDMTVPNPLNPSKPLSVSIIANQIPKDSINVNFLDPENLASILQTRFRYKPRSLDLSSFHMDPNLKEFCMLSQPKLMAYIFQYVSELEPVPFISKIILSDNYIKVLEPLSVIAHIDIQTIDLRNNELATIDDLSPLKKFKKLKNLRLDGNPLCNLYSSYDYVWKLKQVCPSLKTIDTQNIFNASEYFLSKKNFLCDLSGGDLVNQFIEYFFTVYDLEDRRKIVNLYHKDAVFSLTASVIADQKSTTTARMNHYMTINANLRSPARSFNTKHNDKYLFRSSQNIMKIFKYLPRTVHDPLQLKCDLVHYSEKLAIIVVHGIYQEGSEKLGFTRSFILQLDSDDAYRIINDQLHVYNALDCQIKVAYSFPQNVEYAGNVLPYYNRQFWELLEAVRSLTNLNYHYSQKFLDVFNYDLKSVLTNFLKLYTKNEIPPEAFIEPRESQRLFNLMKNKQSLPMPDDVLLKATSKYGFISVNTAWNAIHEERLLALLNVTDPSSQIRDALHDPQRTKEPQEEEPAEPLDDEVQIVSEYTIIPDSIQAFDNQIPSTSKISGNVRQEPITSVINKQRNKALNIIKRALGQDPTELKDGVNKVIAEVVVKTLGIENKGQEKGKTKKVKGKENPVNINVIKQQYYFSK